MGDTVSGVSHLINKIPVVGETLAPSQGISALDKVDTTHGTAEAAGKGLEGIAEFATGDELMEGLSKGVKLVALAKKYPAVAEALDLATRHPWLANMITKGGKGAVVGGVEGAVKGAQEGNVTKGATTGALLGGATGAIEGGVDAARVAKASKLNVNPYRNASKIEPAIDEAVAKAGLPAGTQGVTEQAAAEANAAAKTEAQAATQRNVDQTLQDITQQHSTTHGLPAPKAGTASRDLLQNNGNALINSAKSDYAVLDKYTDGKFTNVAKELKNAQVERTMNAGKTGFDADTLDTNVTRAQMKLDQLFDDAVAKGMPKDVADTAKAKFTAGNATLDIAHDVRMANKIAGDTTANAGERITNLSALENRWQAQYDSGRLQQALGGEQQATEAMKALSSARATAELTAQMPPTETQALRQLIADHTTTTKVGAKTNWGALRDDFSKMSDRGARFSDVAKVEKFINDQAATQNLKKWALRTAVSAPVVGGGVAAYEKYGH
jgi:hypothetical protein